MLLGVLLAVLALEGALRLLPTGTYTDTGYHIDPLIVTYRPGHRFHSSQGWDFSQPQTHHANNLGFLSSRDFVPDPTALVVIGDSFVDASMLPEDERLGGQLQRLLGARPVYAMGGPGSSLLDYAERLRYAAEKLDARDFVLVLERGDARQSYCGSGNVHGPCIDRASGAARTDIRPPARAAQRYLRHSALLQYLLGHLRFDPQARLQRALRTLGGAEGGVAQGPRTGAATNDFSEAEIARVVEAFFARIEPYRRGRLLMVFDSDRVRMEAGESGTTPEREQFMALARAHGAEVIDTLPGFRAAVAASGRHLEISPLDGHWNREATALVAREIVAHLSP
ncbi:MAG: hypothetical protein K2Y51_04795 [Gammaproteobacteria bacterium]|nr:hypothetical protein [Gammaproteobacteria bacterium]